MKKRVSNLFVCSVLMFSCAAQAEYDASSYIKDGLIGHWDAICNEGAGLPHNPEAAVWTNLAADTMHAIAGTGNQTPVWTNGNAMATKNAFATTGLGRFSFTPSDGLYALLDDGPFSLQVAMKSQVEKNTDYSPVWLGTSGKPRGIHTDNGGNHFFRLRHYNSNSGRAQFTSRNDAWQAGTTDSYSWNGQQIMRKTGVSLALERRNLGVQNASSCSGPAVIGNGYIKGGDNHIHALRLYNRPLTELEMAYNAHIDDVRFFGAAKRTRKWVQSHSPTYTTYGNVSPAYFSLTEVDEGSVRTFSLSGLTTDFSDGVLAYPSDSATRALYLGATVKEIVDGSLTETLYPADVTNITKTITADTVVSWGFKVQVLFSVKAVSGGKIRLLNGDTVVSYSCWEDKTKDTVIAVEAVADEGYKFVCWSGDVTGDPLQASQTVDMGAKRLLTALFISENAGTGATHTWIGGADGLFFNPGNWDGAVVPLAGDSIVISPSKNTAIEIPSSTPRYASFRIGEGSGDVMLKMRNWDTALNADTVVIGPKATVSPYASFSSASMSNRVRIVCNDFTLEAGGRINADALGYNSANGPGRGNNNRSGAGHGGRGGHGYTGNFDVYGLSYDNHHDPRMPGSGGANGSGNKGGGVIEIDATGHVALLGAVTADGGDGSYGSSGGGSGGTVNVRSGTFFATNVVSASGGKGPDPKSGYGAGGMIAIRYDTAKQASAGLLPTPILKAASRPYGTDLFPSASSPRPSVEGPNRIRAEDGTIYLSDRSFYTGKVMIDAVGRTAFGEDPGVMTFDSLTVPDETSSDPSGFGRNPTFTNRTLVINGDLSLGRHALATFVDCDVTVKGDVGIDGGWLDVAGNTSFKVEGALTLFSSGIMRVWSGPTNGVGAATWNDFGALVKVGRRMRLEDGSVLFVRSEGRNGGSPKFELKSLYVAPDARINGVGRGWGWYDSMTYNVKASDFGFGPGSGYMAGASHGGWGASQYPRTDAAYHRGTYGDEENPVAPGSDGSVRSVSVLWFGGWGGGLFRAEVSGDVELDGMILMNGTSPESTEEGAGSGGAVNIRCRGFYGSGAIEANGGASGTKNSGAGGGGRIAIRCATDGFSGTIEAVAGASTVNWAYPALDGTLYRKTVPHGLRMIIR